ncbi:hypothetical protein KAR91_65250 [Candidatus Pacearchaeota archaeon]|nr:hypothetical protein [Candidatus Pacearchaeota archaeon]
MLSIKDRRTRGRHGQRKSKHSDRDRDRGRHAGTGRNKPGALSGSSGRAQESIWSMIWDI